MLNFKTLKELNQYNIKNVRVYSDGIFQLEYGKYGPYFYANGQMIPNTNEYVMTPAVNSFRWKNTIRYSSAHIENNENVWYWTVYDLRGNKLADRLVGDNDGPDNSDAIKNVARPNDIPVIPQRRTDTVKMTRPVLKTASQKIWDLADAYWFVDKAKFFQIPSFRKMFENQYQMLADYISTTPNISLIEGEYLREYLGYMNSMDTNAINDKYVRLQVMLNTKLQQQHTK